MGQAERCRRGVLAFPQDERAGNKSVKLSRTLTKHYPIGREPIK